jgi:hypothetical protein
MNWAMRSVMLSVLMLSRTGMRMPNSVSVVECFETAGASG